MNRKRGSEAGSANRHRCALIEPGGNRHHAIAGHARELGIAAIARFREIAPGDEHPIAWLVTAVARLFDHAGEIDAADERIDALLKDDADLNAQGLVVWIERQKRAA
jgi:hypothetical protein